MSNHVIFCSDIASRDASGRRVTQLQGWCIASSPIRGLALQSEDGFEPLNYGMKRADVASAYPDYRGGAISGFRLLAPTQTVPGEAAALWLEIDNGNGKEDHVISVKLDTRNVQTLELNEETRARGTKIDNSIRALEKSATLEAHLRQSLRTRPGLILRLDLINKCNLRCIMCHFADDAVFRRPTKQLNTAEFKALFDELGPSVSHVMLSCGDEPLLSKFLAEILHFLADEHPHVAIEFCTNATLMNAPIRKVMLETRVSRVSFSIDAVSKKLLESIRVGCRYEQVIGNILALRDLKTSLDVKFPNFSFNFVMMDRNIHEGPAFVHLAKALGAQVLDFRHMVIGNNVDHGVLLENQPGKYNYFREAIAKEAQAAGVGYYLPATFPTDERWSPSVPIKTDLADFYSVAADPAGTHLPQRDRLQVVDQQYASRQSVQEEFASTFCARPFSEITLRDQEEVLPCPWHDKPLGYLRDGKSLTDIFFGEDFARVRRNMLRPEGDPNCAHCPIKSGHLPTDAE